jgi:transposase-like protein
MATLRMDITSFVGKLLDQDDVDALREGKRVLAHGVMETEVSTQIGAGPTSGAPNGLPTATGTAPVGGTPASARSSSRSPRSPPALTSPRRWSPAREPRKHHAVVVVAYVKGVFPRKVDDLVRALDRMRSPG